MFRCSDFISATSIFSETNFFAGAETETIRGENNARKKAEHLIEMKTREIIIFEQIIVGDKSHVITSSYNHLIIMRTHRWPMLLGTM